ncbi:hypothetical protein CR513_02267, partial [Mucuna pruriens]
MFNNKNYVIFLQTKIISCDLRSIRFENVSIPFISKASVRSSFSNGNMNEAFKICSIQDSDMMRNSVEMSIDYCNVG